MSSNNRIIPYRPEIDGLRAIAVIPVIFYHANISLFSGGYVGVDIFFVISGYLIASIILREFAENKFSFISFYERRARRILPVLFFVISCCIPVAWFWLTPDELKRFSQSVVSITAFSSNIYFWLSQDYFTPTAEEIPLLHTWSLSVEEQFYMLFPLLVMGLWRFEKNNLIFFLFILTLASFSFAEYSWRNNPVANFYLLPSRAWELLVGSVLALYQAKESRFKLKDEIKDLLSIIGLFLILCSFVKYNAQLPTPSMYTTIPVVGTVLLIAFASPDRGVGKLLSSRSLVLVGLLSYSAYLWHQPIFAFIRLLGAREYLFVGVFATFGLSCLSYLYVEKYFMLNRHHGRRFNYFLLTTLFILFVVGILGHLNKGYPQRGVLPEAEYVARTEFARHDNGFCFYSVSSDRGLEVGVDGTRCSFGREHGAQRRVLLFGDSFAGMYEPFFKKLADNSSMHIVSVTTNWCSPTLTEGFGVPESSERSLLQCRFNHAWIKQNIDKFDTLVISANWANLLDNDKNGFFDFLRLYSAQVEKTLIMPLPPSYSPERINELRRDLFFRGSVESVERFSSVDIGINDDLKKYAAVFPNVSLMPPNAMFPESSGIFSSADGGHLSVWGAFNSFETITNSAIKNEFYDMF
ncbi:MAG: acyltransferase [Alcaligenaceae bacterium]|nr:acyltransferase [Alcaligenaceae bacterium]